MHPICSKTEPPFYFAALALLSRNGLTGEGCTFPCPLSYFGEDSVRTTLESTLVFVQRSGNGTSVGTGTWRIANAGS